MISPRISGRQNFGQVSTESLRRTNELEEMRQRLEARKLLVDKTSIACKVIEQDVKKKEDNLSTEVRSLLVGGTTLSIAKSKLQVLPHSVENNLIRKQGVSLLHVLVFGYFKLVVSLCSLGLFFDRRTYSFDFYFHFTTYVFFI